MGQSFFIWNGIDCRSMGVLMQGPAPIVRPEERVNHVQIPGRSGDLTETEGEYVYNSYIQTVTIMVKGGYRVRDVYRWLRGAGYVTFSGEPDKRQAARIIGAVTLNKHSYNLDWWVGEVQFYCQPLKELLTDSTETVSTSGGTVRNNGDVYSRPMYKITPSGTSVMLSVGYTPEGASAGTVTSLVIAGTTSGTVIWVDSDTMEVWNAAKTELLTADSAGDFPQLGPGDNTIQGSGWSSIEIEKRERFL